jgi:hypothetical protein
MRARTALLLPPLPLKTATATVTQAVLGQLHPSHRRTGTQKQSLGAEQSPHLRASSPLPRTDITLALPVQNQRESAGNCWQRATTEQPPMRPTTGAQHWQSHRHVTEADPLQ